MVSTVQGSVVDVRFENNLLGINTVLYCRNREILIEVAAQLDTHIDLFFSVGVVLRIDLPEVFLSVPCDH